MGTLRVRKYRNTYEEERKAPDLGAGKSCETKLFLLKEYVTCRVFTRKINKLTFERKQ